MKRSPYCYEFSTVDEAKKYFGNSWVKDSLDNAKQEIIEGVLFYKFDKYSVAIK